MWTVRFEILIVNTSCPITVYTLWLALCGVSPVFPVAHADLKSICKHSFQTLVNVCIKENENSSACMT